MDPEYLRLLKNMLKELKVIKMFMNYLLFMEMLLDIFCVELYNFLLKGGLDSLFLILELQKSKLALMEMFLLKELEM